MEEDEGSMLHKKELDAQLDEDKWSSCGLCSAGSYKAYPEKVKLLFYWLKTQLSVHHSCCFVVFPNSIFRCIN